MPRLLDDWLSTYLKFTAGTEPPQIFHFWCGVSAIAGALRKHVWNDQLRFKWVPNFYIILVAPPGVISKTTTMDLAMDLLKKVPTIRFGPDIVTWPALVKVFAESCEQFAWGDLYIPMSAMTLASGEFGNLINPRDPELMTLYITLYDGKAGIEKVTKTSGSDSVNAPYLNMIGCTTPDWLAENMPLAAIGGGFTSRCIFVYGDKKENFIAWPRKAARDDVALLKNDLIADLEHIATNLIGEVGMTAEAEDWYEALYIDLWKSGRAEADDDLVKNYLARKQAHMVKLAMVLVASSSDTLMIEKKHLTTAHDILGVTEKGFSKVFAKIGRSEDSLHAERLLEFIRRRGTVTYPEAYRHVHLSFPNFNDFNGVLQGLVRSGQIRLEGADLLTCKFHFCGGNTPT